MTGELAERARIALRDAGDRSFALNAFAAAARWYRAALELWPAGNPERPRVLLGLGTALFHAQEAGDQELADASAALLAAGDREAAAEAEVLLARLTSWRGAQPTSLGHTRHAAALLEDAGPSPAKALALANLAADRMLAGDNAEAIRVGTDALALVDDLGLDGVAPPSAQLRRHRPPRRRRPRRARRPGTCGRRSLQLTSPDSVVAYINLASALIELGELPRGFELQAEGLRTTERFGFGSYVRHLVAERVIEDYWRGRWDAAARARTSSWPSPRRAPATRWRHRAGRFAAPSGWRGATSRPRSRMPPRGWRSPGRSETRPCSTRRLPSTPAPPSPPGGSRRPAPT